MVNFYSIILSPYTLILCILSLIYLFRDKLEEYLANLIIVLIQRQQKRQRPRRIFLVRHGNSVANNNYDILQQIPDNKIVLSENGIAQAKEAGKRLKEIIGNESIEFYVSPYMRTRQTYENILESFKENRTECNIFSPLREQEYGNLQSEMDRQFKEQKEVGIPYYRFKNGESGIDVLNRISVFLQYLFRKISSTNYKLFDNIIIVSHELTLKFFILCFLKLPVNDYDNIKGLDNADFWTIEKNENGKYQLKNDISFKRAKSSIIY